MLIPPACKRSSVGQARGEVLQSHQGQGLLWATILLFRDMVLVFRAQDRCWSSTITLTAGSRKGEEGKKAGLLCLAVFLEVTQGNFINISLADLDHRLLQRKKGNVAFSLGLRAAAAATL